MKVTSYQEAKNYLESFIRPTIFARIEADKHLTDPLQRMRYLLELLGNPQNTYPSIQVSGTSGKGSTSYLISHILKTAGYKVGYTLSPHLQTVNERIQMNNIPVSDAEFVETVNDVIPAIDKMSQEWIGQPSYFEIILAMALNYFAKKHVDIVVAEVGLEGRYDGTNALHPILGVLTNISLDHTRILGDTVEKIADEATSIIKEKDMTIVTGINQASLKDMVKRKAEVVTTDVVWVESGQLEDIHISTDVSRFSFKSSKKTFYDLSLQLIGSYQLMNAAVAIESVLALPTTFKISDEQIREALQTATFPGRFEIVSPDKAFDPLIVLDGAHNPAKMEAFLGDLETLYPTQKKVFLVAFKEDKKIDEMIKMIEPLATSIVTTEFTFVTDLRSVATSAEDIKKVIEEKSEVISVPDTIRAFTKAKQIASEQDGIVVVTGSLYLVGEIRTLLGRRI